MKAVLLQESGLNDIYLFIYLSRFQLEHVLHLSSGTLSVPLDKGNADAGKKSEAGHTSPWQVFKCYYARLVPFNIRSQVLMGIQNGDD